MTILAQTYKPTVHNIRKDRRYYYRFPIADEASIEVYEIDANEVRTQVPRGDYEFDHGTVNPRYPIRFNGQIVMGRDPTPGTRYYSVERNTLIVQTQDQGTFRPFNIRMIEFALDRATLICQELAYRKCDAVVGTTMTQEYLITAYDEFRAQSLNDAVEKLYQILREIDGSAESCRDRPDET